MRPSQLLAEGLNELPRSPESAKGRSHVRCAGGSWPSEIRRTLILTHAGPKDAAREAELNAPSGVVCSDFVRHPSQGLFFRMRVGNHSEIIPMVRSHFSTN